MPGSNHGPSIKNPRVYEALRRRGYSKARAAAISNARRTKAFNFGAKVGQTIAGNLVRGAGGRFSAGTGVSTPTARQTRTADRRDARAKRRDASARARDEAARQEDATRAKEDAYVSGGKNARERAARRREVTAARKKRTADAREAARQAREQERQTRAEEDASERSTRDQEQAQRDADKAARAAKPKKGGGGKGGKAKPTDAEKLAAQSEAKRTRAAATAQAAGLSAGNLDQLRAAAETGTDPQQAAALAAVGLVSTNPETGQAETTDQGRRALAALERGDIRGYRAALQDARSRMQREQAAATRRSEADARRAARDAERQSQEPRSRRTRARDVNTKPQVVQKAAPGTLATFKDAKGQDRWLTITTSAYEDREAEIITTKAIAFAVAYGDATGQRGTLRYWHVPGADLGPCDFQAQAGPGGRWLVESGTFFGPREAALGAAMAQKGWHMSPGFLHPRSEPTPLQFGHRQVGAYEHLVIFERSPTPPNRASNLFGSFTTTKETRMNSEKRAQLKELVGGNEALLTELLGRIEQTDTAAQDQGMAFKDAPPWAQALVARIDALEASLKETPAETVDAAPAAAEVTIETDVDADGVLDDEGFADLVADKVAARMAKASTTQKEAPATAKQVTDLQAQLQALSTTVKELTGDVPARSRQALEVGVPAPLGEITQKEGEDPVAAFVSRFNFNGVAQ